MNRQQKLEHYVKYCHIKYYPPYVKKKLKARLASLDRRIAYLTCSSFWHFQNITGMLTDKERLRLKNQFNKLDQQRKQVRLKLKGYL